MNREGSALPETDGDPAAALALLRAEIADVRARKDDFIDMVCHELRTPLTGLIGYTELMQAGQLGPLSAQQQQAVAVMLGQQRRMQRLIESLLRSAMLERDDCQLQLKAADLARLVETAVATVRGRPGVENEFFINAGELPLVICDHDLVMQAVLNLLDNAVKFSPPSSPITIAVNNTGDAVEIVVIDRGPGIATADRERVFEKFAQAERTSTRRHGGIGLGLAIVRQVAALHGGSVRVEDPPPGDRGAGGRGTVMVLRLPL